MKKIKLNEFEILELNKPVSGNGGFQSLMRSLQNKLDNSGNLKLDDKILKRIKRYAFDYDRGGWQGRLIRIFGRHFGSNLERI